MIASGLLLELKLLINLQCANWMDYTSYFAHNKEKENNGSYVLYNQLGPLIDSYPNRSQIGRLPGDAEVLL